MTEFQKKANEYHFRHHLRMENALSSVPRKLRCEMRCQLDDIGLIDSHEQNIIISRIIEQTEGAKPLEEMLEKEVG